jgi:hypothetical protein
VLPHAASSAVAAPIQTIRRADGMKRRVEDMKVIPHQAGEFDAGWAIGGPACVM